MIYTLIQGLYPTQGSIHAPEMLKIIMCKILRRLKKIFLSEKQHWIIVLEIVQCLKD